MRRAGFLQQVVRMCCLTVFLISLMSVAGYTIGDPSLTRWTKGESVGMALNTAICFMLTSLSIFLLTVNGYGKQPEMPFTEQG